MKTNMKRVIQGFLKIVCIISLFYLAPSISFAASDAFPPYEEAPALTSYVSGGTFQNTFYIAPDGSDTSGDGSIGNPWASVNGARTGGAGPGDLIYFRGGTYVATQDNTGWKAGYYYYDHDGTSSYYTVFSAYPGEIPVFTTNADERISINIRGDYVVLDSLKFTSGSLTIRNGEHVVVQNCTFDGQPYDPMNDQINAGHLYLNDGAHYATIRNNYFSTTHGHSVKTYASDRMPTNLTLEYNRFYQGVVSYGLITFKSAISGHEIRNNRFEGIGADVISIGSSYSGSHNGINIHDNVFDGCTGSILTKLGTSSTGEVQNLNFYNNVVYNASSGDRDMLELDCGDGCLSGATHRLGEFYNNVFYDLNDLIDSESATDFTNYPSYWNYNAYQSVSLKATAENRNDESAAVWQGNALVVDSHGITRTGEPGNHFYFIDDSSQFVGAGRNNTNIGGFLFLGGYRISAPAGFKVEP